VTYSRSRSASVNPYRAGSSTTGGWRLSSPRGSRSAAKCPCVCTEPPGAISTHKRERERKRVLRRQVRRRGCVGGHDGAVRGLVMRHCGVAAAVTQLATSPQREALYTVALRDSGGTGCTGWEGRQEQGAHLVRAYEHDEAHGLLDGLVRGKLPARGRHAVGCQPRRLEVAEPLRQALRTVAACVRFNPAPPHALNCPAASAPGARSPNGERLACCVTPAATAHCGMTSPHAVLPCRTPYTPLTARLEAFGHDMWVGMGIHDV
jgi:hypothetical protein